METQNFVWKTDGNEFAFLEIRHRKDQMVLNIFTPEVQKTREFMITCQSDGMYPNSETTDGEGNYFAQFIIQITGNKNLRPHDFRTNLNNLFGCDAVEVTPEPKQGYFEPDHLPMCDLLENHTVACPECHEIYWAEDGHPQGTLCPLYGSQTESPTYEYEDELEEWEPWTKEDEDEEIITADGERAERAQLLTESGGDGDDPDGEPWGEYEEDDENCTKCGCPQRFCICSANEQPVCDGCGAPMHWCQCNEEPEEAKFWVTAECPNNPNWFDFFGDVEKNDVPNKEKQLEKNHATQCGCDGQISISIGPK